MARSKKKSAKTKAGGGVGTLERRADRESGDAMERSDCDGASAPAIFRCDDSGKVTQANSRLSELTGCPREELTAHAFFDFVHPQDVKRVRAGWKDAVADRGSLHHELRISRTDGEAVAVVFQFEPELGDDGELSGYWCAVTETSNNSVEHGKSEERLQRAVDVSTIGVWDWPDLAEGSEWLSPRVYELLGYAPGEFPASRTTIREMLHPDDREAGSAALQDHLENGASFDEECRLRTKNGDYRWFNVSGEAERDEAGAPVGLTGTIRDITERRSTEEALRESEERLQTLARMSPVGIIRLDLEGAVTFANERALQITGLASEDTEERQWARAIHPDDRERSGKKLQAAVSSQGSFSDEYRFVRPDGSVVWVLGQAEPEFNELGGLSGHVGTLTDITDRKNAELALRHRAEFERLCSNLSASLLRASAEDIRGIVLEAFEALGEREGLDRINLVQSSNRHQKSSMMAIRWFSGGDTRQEDEDDILSAWPWLLDEMAAGRMVTANRIEDLPDEAFVDRESATNKNVKSFVFIPLQFTADVVGAISAATTTEERNWSNEFVGRLRFIGEIVSNALLRCWTDDALRDEHSRLRNILDSVNATIVIFGPDGRTIQLHERAPEIRNTGMSMEDMAKTPVWETYWISHDPDLQESTRKAFAEALEGKTVQFDARMRIADDVFVTVDLTFAPVYGASGKVEHVVGSGIDVTTRVESQQQLLGEKQRLQNLMQGVNASVGILSTEGILLEANQHPFHGTQILPEDAIGKPFWEGYWWSYDPKVQKRIRKAVKQAASGSVARFDVSSRMTEDRYEVVDMTFAPLTDSDGTVTNVVCSGLTITERVTADLERKELEAQVQHSQKLESLGVLAGGIAHDFNNLLVSIMGHADLALDTLADASPEKENLTQILNASKSAADLARQMLAYSGKGKFVVTPLSMSELVLEMGHLLQVSVSKKAKVRYRLEKELPCIEADAAQIQQVVMNLITNASDALGEDPGIIVVKTGVMECDEEYLNQGFPYAHLSHGRYVFLEVSDTGSGMDQETLDKMFDPFYTTKFAGRGLGLAAVVGIVRGHHGAMHVHSKPTKGTQFRLLFPALVDIEAAPELPLSAVDLADVTGTILVVDDEEAVRKFTVLALERFGFNVVCAKNGQEGLELFMERGDELAAVLLDMTMPVLNGEETYRAMRDIRLDIPIVLMSGYTEREAAHHFTDGGLAGYLQKPFRLDALRSRLAKVLSGKVSMLDPT